MVRRFSGRPFPHASFYDVSCLDVLIPGVLRVAVDHVSVRWDVKIDRGGFAVGRVMDFRGRPGPDKPKAQMFEDIPDDRRILDGTDDPHGPLTLTDQRIDLVDLM